MWCWVTENTNIEMFHARHDIISSRRIWRNNPDFFIHITYDISDSLIIRYILIRNCTASIKSVTPQSVDPNWPVQVTKYYSIQFCLLTHCSTWCVILTRIVWSRRDWMNVFNNRITWLLFCLFLCYLCVWVLFCHSMRDNLPTQSAIC